MAYIRTLLSQPTPDASSALDALRSSFETSINDIDAALVLAEFWEGELPPSILDELRQLRELYQQLLEMGGGAS